MRRRVAKRRGRTRRDTSTSRHSYGGVKLCPCPGETRSRPMVTFDPEDPYYVRDPSRRKRRRDQDYRGTRTTVDWTRLVHMARLGKPGAVEVLQDAIQQYFPRQLEREIDHAESMARSRRKEYVIVFNPYVARARFRPVNDPRSESSSRPFGVFSLMDLEEFHRQRPGLGPRELPFHLSPQRTAVIWSSRTGSDVSNPVIRRIQRRTGGVRGTRGRNVGW